MKDLSILIPARNEMFLARTIEDILEHIEADTEIIVVLDGVWPEAGIPQHERVNIIYVHEAIGQRAATNMACRLAQGKYVMKVDAHCSFDQGFDRKMIAEMQDDWTMVPVMRNLWAFDWKCHDCGWKKYQGPTPTVCEQCGKKDNIRRKMMWVGKQRPQSTSYCFDAGKEVVENGKKKVELPHFRYFEEYKHRPEYQKAKEELGLTESMSIQGSCFMLTKEKYLELNICDESFGSWGNQGIEVACKTWLSGGRVIINHKTWYAHLFRTQGGDFGFPYSQSENKVQDAKRKVWDFFFTGWEKQIHPMSWLVKKFWPVTGWTQKDLDNIQKTQ